MAIARCTNTPLSRKFCVAVLHSNLTYELRQDYVLNEYTARINENQCERLARMIPIIRILMSNDAVPAMNGIVIKPNQLK